MNHRSEGRWLGVDVAKGIAIVMLAFGIANLWLTADPHFEGFDGPYLNPGWPRFLARFVTSTTPPTFFALSGIVVGKRLADLSVPAERSRWVQHLFARGLFLVALELVVTQLYNVSHPGTDYIVVFEVLSAFGWSFILVAVGHRASSGVAVVVALALWVVPELFGSPLFVVADQPPWRVEYPVASWLPFILIGIALGRRFAANGMPTAAAFAKVALGAAVAFILVRAATTFGSLGQPAPQTVMQFLSPTKYPVSLHYALLGSAGAAATLSVGTLLRTNAALGSLGKQPLLSFLLVKVLVAVVQVAFDIRGRLGGIAGALAVSAVIVAVLIPLTRAYDRLKRRAGGRFVALRLL